MKRVINDLKKIHGLKHAYIQREGEASISTFGEEKMSMMHSSAELIEQYFMAAEGIEKSYNEMIFPLDNGDKLIAFLGKQNTLIIVLTQEKMNLPMLQMAFTVVIKKLTNGTYQQQTIRDAKESKLAVVAAKKPVQPIQERENTITNPIPASSTTAKKPRPKTTVSPFKTLFSNPFTSKTQQDKREDKSDERPYTLYRGKKLYSNETAKKPQEPLVEKKLVYRGQKE